MLGGLATWRAGAVVPRFLAPLAGSRRAFAPGSRVSGPVFRAIAHLSRRAIVVALPPRPVTARVLLHRAGGKGINKQTSCQSLAAPNLTFLPLQEEPDERLRRAPSCRDRRSWSETTQVDMNRMRKGRKKQRRDLFPSICHTSREVSRFIPVARGVEVSRDDGRLSSSTDKTIRWFA